MNLHHPQKVIDIDIIRSMLLRVGECINLRGATDLLLKFQRVKNLF